MATSCGDATSSDLLSRNIYALLESYESAILYFQRVLVWEKPTHSAVFLFISHVMFWYICVRSSHAIGFLFSLALMLMWIDVWKHKIWPEIRAESPDEEAEWGELNPQLLSLREMCKIMADLLISINSAKNDFLNIRRNHPGKFCLCFNAFCLVLIFVGSRIPGSVLAYVLLLCLLFWPLISCNKILEKAYTSVEPFLMQLQYTLQQRPSETYQLAKSIADNQAQKSDNDSDDDISEFVPILDEKTAAVLAKAITDESELSETDEEILANELPSFSRASTPDEMTILPKEIPHNLENDSDNDDDFGLPQLPDYNENTSRPQTYIPINRDLMVDAISNMVRDTFSTLTKSHSTSSTPTSDYEFVVLSSEDED